MKKLKTKKRRCQKKRSSREVRGVSPEAGRESMVGKVCERGRRHCVRWIKILLGTEAGLGPVDIVLDRDPAHPQKGVQQSLTFRPMSSVVKTVAHLSNC